MKKISNSIFRKIDRPLFVITVILLIIGLLNIVTASSREAVERYDKTLFYYFFQHLKMIGLGVVASLFILKFPTKLYKKYIMICFFIIVGILLYLLFKVDAHKGAKNWISIFGFTFQPSEFSKPIIIIYLSLLFEKYQKIFRSNHEYRNTAIAKVLFVGALVPFIVFFQKDLGTAFIIACIFGVNFLSSPILKKDKFRIIIGVVGLLFVVIIGFSGKVLTSKQVERFNFINPCNNYYSGGYQVCNGFIGINDGGLFGVGRGKSKLKYSYIPEPHTDSIFIIIAEENGFIKSTAIIILYIFLIKRIIFISSKSETIRGRYICLGVATMIFMHILINLGGFFGLIPLTGVPLPFLSYGGSFLLTLMGSIALVQRVNIENKTKKIKI